MGVFQRMLVPVSTFQVVGRAAPSSTPLAAGPRKEGQLAAAGAGGRGRLEARGGASAASTSAEIRSGDFIDWLFPSLQGKHLPGAVITSGATRASAPERLLPIPAV